MRKLPPVSASLPGSGQYLKQNNFCAIFCRNILNMIVYQVTILPSCESSPFFAAQNCNRIAITRLQIHTCHLMTHPGNVEITY